MWLLRARTGEAGPGITDNVVRPGLTDITKVAASAQASSLSNEVMSSQVIKKRVASRDCTHAFIHCQFLSSVLRWANL